MANATYSQQLGIVMNSKRMYLKPLDARTTLAERLEGYETPEELPPDLRREFEECLASGLFEFGVDPSSSEVADIA